MKAYSVSLTERPSVVALPITGSRDSCIPNGRWILGRHFFNRRHQGAREWRYPIFGATVLGGVAWWTTPHLAPLPKVNGPVTFDQVRAIIGQWCVTCHSPMPTFTGLTAPPAGVLLHTPDAILQNAQRIYQQVVVTRIMPLGNVTQVTDYERAVVAAWVADGAKAK